MTDFIAKFNLQDETPISATFSIGKVEPFNAKFELINSPIAVNQDITITENGTYIPDKGYTGFGEINVNVDVEPNNQDKIITENGIYTADEGYTGLGEITVNVNTATQDKTITENGVYTADNGYVGLGEVTVNVNTGKYTITVIDYDGTILKEAKLNTGDVFILPEPPTHEKLIFQEWSSTQPLEIDNTLIVQDSDVIIGAIYDTKSGKCEFDITLTKTTGLTVTMNIVNNKNWGDGTIDSNTSHTYADYGTYTITFDKLTQINSTAFSQSGSDINYSLTAIRLTNLTTLTGTFFQYCASLKTVTFSNSVNTLGASFFQHCRSLKCVVFPNKQNMLQNYMFSYCRALENVVIPYGISSIPTGFVQYCQALGNVILPDSITTINQYAFRYCYKISKVKLPKNLATIPNYSFQSCFALKTITLSNKITSIGTSAFSACYLFEKIKIPSSVTTIQAQAFSTCYALIEYDFTEHTSVPTLANTNVFSSINEICKIKVPANLYYEWIASTNWSTYADYIEEV